MLSSEWLGEICGQVGIGLALGIPQGYVNIIVCCQPPQVATTTEK